MICLGKKNYREMSDGELDAWKQKLDESGVVGDPTECTGELFMPCKIQLGEKF